MFELYQMMQQTQGKPIPAEPIKPFVNVEAHFKFLVEYFNSIKNNPDFFEKNSTKMDIFYYGRDDTNINEISTAHNVPIEEVKRWIGDPAYKNLVEQQMTNLIIPPKFEKKINNVCASLFNLREDLVVKFWTQRPGQLAPLHYDRKKHIYFDIDPEESSRIKRYILFLDDQREGQVFYMAGHYVSWKAGDVLGWDQIHYQHGSANFGYEERPNLLITGVENKN